MRILLVGMYGLYNRGCEAIVWGSAEILRQMYPGAEIGVAVGYPDTVAVDQARLHDLDVEWYPYTHRLSRSIVSRLGRRIQRAFFGPAPIRYAFPLDGWDLILEVGGDTFVGDNVRSRFRDDTRLMKMTGKPIGLWGMNLGPYRPEVLSVDELRAACSQYEIITVRDDFSYQYLRDNGVETNVYRMADPAFAMRPKAFDLSSILPPPSPQGLVGLNLSPYAARCRADGIAGTQHLAYETALGLLKRGFSVLFVPHCFAPACPPFDDDCVLLQSVYEQLRAAGYPVGIIPAGLSAPEVKHAISHCTLYAGARMHSTIAAWSTGVPVLTLAYSQKARNLNTEIYNDERYFVDIARATASEIVGKLLVLANELNAACDETTQGILRMLRHTETMLAQVTAQPQHRERVKV